MGLVRVMPGSGRRPTRCAQDTCALAWLCGMGALFAGALTGGPASAQDAPQAAATAATAAGSSAGHGRGSNGEGREARDPRSAATVEAASTPRDEPSPDAEPEHGPPRRAELLPRSPLARAAGWFLPPEPSPGTREERAEAELDAWLTHEVNGDRMSAIGAAPWYAEVGRAMRRAFRPDLAELGRQRRAPMGTIARVVDELRRYAQAPGQPQGGPGAQVPPEQSAQARSGTSESRELARTFDDLDARNFLNAPVTWYGVEVRVVHNPEGEISAAWVARSSGYSSLDHAALEAVRSGVVSVARPPAEVVGTRDAIRSDWLFEAGDVATRVTDAGCVDDPVHGGVQCAALGHGIGRTRVRLLRVVDATHETPEERRARVRANQPTLGGDDSD